MGEAEEGLLYPIAESGDHAALAELQRLADRENVEALFLLGRLYDVPERPRLLVDFGQARDWYERAAVRGHALAQFFLGNMYDYGIRRGSFTSVKQFVQRIDHFVTAYNTRCQPFKWTATEDSILEKLHRLSSRTSGTEH